MALSAANLAAFSAPAVRAFLAVLVTLGSTSIALIDGSAVIPMLGTTFSGYDPIYGSLSAISTITENFTTSAPQIQVTFLPPSIGGVAALSDPGAQGSSVKVYVGALNEATGLVVADPELIFLGQLDTAKVTDNVMRSLELTVSTGFERFFLTSEAETLSPTSHKDIWPGETGLDNNIEALADPWWGSDAVTPIVPAAPLVPTLNDRLSGIRVIPQ